MRVSGVRGKVIIGSIFSIRAIAAEKHQRTMIDSLSCVPMWLLPTITKTPMLRRST